MIRAERTSPPDASIELLVIDRRRIAIHVRQGERTVIGEISPMLLRRILAEVTLLPAGEAQRTEGAGSAADASEIMNASRWRNDALAAGFGALAPRSGNSLTTPAPEGLPDRASILPSGAEIEPDRPTRPERHERPGRVTAPRIAQRTPGRLAWTFWTQIVGSLFRAKAK
ncbi:MAG TPA: hypothetical protein VGN57_14120 [Pirellulaceae bacterium]|nr:hypothetical protein [Pirellulaceae bacterium]